MSENSKQILFLKEDGIYTINADGTGQLELIYNLNLSNLNIRGYSQNFEKIVVYENDSYYVSDIDSDNKIKISETNEQARDYTLSPAGEKVAFLVPLDPEDFYEDDYNLYIINSDGTGKTLIKTIDAGYQNVFGLCWESNGERIAFSIQENFDSDSKIYVANVDGSDSNFIAYGFYPKWSSS